MRVTSDSTTPSRTPELSVVMPVYNEADGVGPVILSWIGELERLGITFELLAYDDGSRDRSREVLEQVAATHGAVSAKHHANMGHGPTILRGYREAAGDWVFQIDSDDEIAPDAFERLWKARADFDLLLGCRQNRKSTLPRRIMSAGSRLMVRALFDRGLWDVNTPFRLIRRPALTAMLPRIPPDAFAPNVIMAGLALRDGLRIHQAWVSHQPRRFGTGSIVGMKQWKTAWRCAAETAAVAFARRTRVEPATALRRDVR